MGPGDRTPNPAPPHMTANNHTRGTRVNTSVGQPTPEEHAAALDADAQALLDYLDERGDCTFEQLRGRLRLPKVYLQSILHDLEEDGYIDVNAGFSSVRITRLDKDRDPRDIIPDGGVETEHASGNITVDLAARDIYRAACNRRRRATIRTLAALRDADDVEISRFVPVLTLACAIVAARDGIEPEDVDVDDRTSVYVTLIQTHLPLLDRLGLVTYHDRPQKVELTEEGHAFAELLLVVDRVAVRTEGRPDADLFRDTDTDEWVGDR